MPEICQNRVTYRENSTITCTLLNLYDALRVSSWSSPACSRFHWFTCLPVTSQNLFLGTQSGANTLKLMATSNLDYFSDLYLFQPCLLGSAVRALSPELPAVLRVSSRQLTGDLNLSSVPKCAPGQKVISSHSKGSVIKYFKSLCKTEEDCYKII